MHCLRIKNQFVDINKRFGNEKTLLFPYHDFISVTASQLMKFHECTMDDSCMRSDYCFNFFWTRTNSSERVMNWHQSLLDVIGHDSIDIHDTKMTIHVGASVPMIKQASGISFHHLAWVPNLRRPPLSVFVLYVKVEMTSFPLLTPNHYVGKKIIIPRMILRWAIPFRIYV